jgi:hypothetical protein
MTEPMTGFPGDAEGAAVGDSGAELLGGGQIASRGVGDLDPLHGQSSAVDSIGQWPPADFGPKRYEIDTSGNRVAPAALPGE